MAWSYGEQPPSYFETVRNNDQPTPVLVGIATVTLYRKSNIPTGVLEQARISEVRQSTVTYQPEARQETRNNRMATEVTCHATNTRSECRQNTFNRTVVGSLNASNRLKGLLDVLYEEKKLNKSWFYEVYSAINQLSNGAEEMLPHRLCIITVLAFVKDPLAYIVVLFLMIPFLVFTTAIYLPDYDTLRYEVAPSAIDTVQVLGPCFTFSFLITNFQAVIATVMIATVVFCVMAVLWTVISYVYSWCSNDC